MPDNAGLPDEQTGEIVLPPPVNLSSERVVPYGLYLIDDGQTQFLWVGRDAVPQLIVDVFGLPDKSQLRVGKQNLPDLDNDMNQRVRAVIEKSRDHRSKGCGSIVVPHLYVVKEDGEPGLRLWAQTMHGQLTGKGLTPFPRLSFFHFSPVPVTKTYDLPSH